MFIQCYYCYYYHQAILLSFHFSRFLLYSNLIYYNKFLPLLNNHLSMHLYISSLSKQMYLPHVIFHSKNSLHNIFHLPISLFQIRQFYPLSILLCNIFCFSKYKFLCFITISISYLNHSSFHFKIRLHKTLQHL